MNARRVAGYIRVSKDGREGTASLAEQEKLIRQRSGRIGGRLVETFFDVEVTESQQRPGLTRLLAKAQVGAFDVVVVAEPSRLFRDPERVQAFTAMLQRQYGVEVCFVETLPEGDVL